MDCLGEWRHELPAVRFLVVTNSRPPSSALSHPFFGEGSPKIDCRIKATLTLTSLLEDLSGHLAPENLQVPVNFAMVPPPAQHAPPASLENHHGVYKNIVGRRYVPQDFSRRGLVRCGGF